MSGNHLIYSTENVNTIALLLPSLLYIPCFNQTKGEHTQNFSLLCRKNVTHGRKNVTWDWCHRRVCHYTITHRHI